MNSMAYKELDCYNFAQKNKKLILKIQEGIRQFFYIVPTVNVLNKHYYLLW